MKNNPSYDALLSDICIATSAAPTYLPAHYFKTADAAGGVLREFNLIDGGVAANNPVPKKKKNPIKFLFLSITICFLINSDLLISLFLFFIFDN